MLPLAMRTIQWTISVPGDKGGGGRRGEGGMGDWQDNSGDYIRRGEICARRSRTGQRHDLARKRKRWLRE